MDNKRKVAICIAIVAIVASQIACGDIQETVNDGRPVLEQIADDYGSSNPASDALESIIDAVGD